MMTDTKTEDRADKIRRLLAKAEGASTPEEAELFAEKAQALMSKWSIDELMIAAAAGKQTQEDVQVRRFRRPSTYFVTDVQLFAAVAYANDVQVLQSKKFNLITLVGFPGDLDRVELLVSSLLEQLNRAVKALEVPSWWPSTEKYVYRRSFRLGFASRVGQRLQDAKNAAEREAASNSSFLPALITKKDAVEKLTNELSTGKSRGGNLLGSLDGYARGQHAADGADITPRRGIHA